MKVVSIPFFVFKKWQKSCWGCGSNRVIGWGFQQGRQRYKCKDCGLLFTWQNKGVRQANYFEWFRRWVLCKDTLEMLSADSGYSKRKLQMIFESYLQQAPTFIIHNKCRLRLIIDGTYFSDDLCLVLYYDSRLRYSCLYRFSSNEFYSEIKEDLENLKRLGMDVASVTCDGKRSIFRAVKAVYPTAIVQRCLVHVQRMVRSWLTRTRSWERVGSFAI